MNTLRTFNGLIPEEASSSFRINPKVSSVSKIVEHYPIPNPYQQVTARELQTKPNELKGHVPLIKNEVLSLKTKDL